ncbi:hypothetical protein IW261DRAFT_1073312 [Armillaria novae-zelandiae]|uniref:Mid2 domain-containing protein n=1 Tax=Armillaria novae-zelandiae TaxID=153914 RepID=A0AA39PD85_9AGAR|nr:hypothetical protein IW261DRAFT_1073312 [Armillaria novae-zelandiae]
MLRMYNACPEAFGGDRSLTHSFNLRSEYSGNISLSISGRGEPGLQTGASNLNGDTEMASSSSNGDKDNSPSATSRSSFDSYDILKNRNFDGGVISLGDGVRTGPGGIDIGFGTDYTKDREDKGKDQDHSNSSTAEHHSSHSSGHHTHSQGSNASPSQSAEGGKNFNSKDDSGSGKGGNESQGAASNNAGSDAGQNNGSDGGKTSSGDGLSPEPSPSNTTPNPTDSQTRLALTSTSFEPSERSTRNVASSPLTGKNLGASGSSSSATEETALMAYVFSSTESVSSLRSTVTSVATSSHVSSTGSSPTASLNTASTAMASPSSTPTNSRDLIGGIIGGIIAFSALLGLLLFLFVRKQRRSRITSSLFNFDTEKFVGAKRSAESVGEACVSTSETHLVSPTVVKWEPASGGGDDRCHDDHDEAFRPTRGSRDEVLNPFQDVAHARSQIISDPFARP